VRTTIGALLAGLLVAISPLKLAVLLILPLIFLTGGFFTRFYLQKAYRKPSGVALMALCVVVGVGLTYRMWTKTSDDTAVHVVLVLIALVIGLRIAFALRRSESLQPPVRMALFVGVILVTAVGAYLTTTVNLSDTTVKEVPTMLFGLGAIMLAREPRGVLYDMVNRQRMRQLEDLERREEEAALGPDGQLAGVAS
jgi:uncharacterized membrane protein YoaK (UPF0700 family)